MGGSGFTLCVEAVPKPLMLRCADFRVTGITTVVVVVFGIS
jgi:hypothetical protein